MFMTGPRGITRICWPAIESKVQGKAAESWHQMTSCSLRFSFLGLVHAAAPIFSRPLVIHSRVSTLYICSKAIKLSLNHHRRVYSDVGAIDSNAWSFEEQCPHASG